MGQTLLIRLYGVLFCLVFALIFTGQVLSFAGHYRLLPVLAGSVLVWLAALWLYFRRAPGWPEQAFLPPATPAAPRLDALCMVLAVLALSSAFLLRLALFPGSVAGNVIAGDALSYHFVRAVELVRSGTMWDLAIAYGEYPAGYESLVSLGVLLTGTVYPAGLVHALIVLLLALTLALLLRRYTRLPAALALLLATLVLFIPDFFSQSLVVGKNDLLLSVL
ncbi:MAG: hypothetical protein MUE40_14265, partial [Anaerolineae bacterium]|nr:hypothetical protein [Anaerolineae bacterium]